MEKKYGLTALGSAIVDIISYKKKDFLNKYELTEGSMTLIENKKAEEIYKELGAATQCSGGSAANTAAVFGLLGGDAGFIGKTKNDILGGVFKREIEKANTTLFTEPTIEGLSTSKCIILVTEEELEGGKVKIERTMATYLDFNVIINEEDIKEQDIAASEIIFFEGYLFDSEGAKNAVLKAIKMAKENNTKVAFTVSDPFCVERHRDEFLEILPDCDVIFANENEATSLFSGQSVKEVLHNFTKLNAISCITLGEDGSYIIKDSKINEIEAVEVEEVYDVTGAGDAYAAGFLFGLHKNLDVKECGRIASASAAEVIKYLGARPQTDLKKLL